MHKECFICKADLSSWEGESCISCSPDTRWERQFSNTERALQILEAENGPISVYDICRGMRREFGGQPSENSIRMNLATDRRFCWAGRSMYGLYRHKLLPGPRNLAGVAKFLLYSAGVPMNAHFLSFLMRFLGYRFHEQSLKNALAFDFDVARFGSGDYSIGDSDETARALNRLGFAPSLPEFHRLANRWRGFMVEGLKEYGRRISRDS